MASISFREVTTQATLEEKKKLRKGLSYFDMIFYTLAALIGLDTLGAFSANGSPALTWTLISAVTFLIPYGLLTAELGSTFSQEGGVYVWCKLAGGRLYGAFGAMLYWISNPLWLGGTLSVGAITAIKILWFQNPDYKFGGGRVSDAIIEIAIALVFIWGSIWCAIMSLRYGKYLSIFGSYLKLALLSLFTILSIIFIFGGFNKSGNSFIAANLLPRSPADWRLIVSGILPVLIFQWVGFEVQNGAGEEMENPQRDVPRSIIRSGLTSAVAYSLFLIVILLALPPSQLSNVSGFLNAFQAVLGVLPSQLATGIGWIIAVAFAVTLASSGATWIMGADRTYAVSALDRTAPVIFGRFSRRFGTPISVNILTGILGTIAITAAVLVNSFGPDNATGLFTLVLGFVISTTTLSYLFIFPAFLILRYKYPDVQRPYKVPGGMIGAWLVMLLPLAYAAIATYYILIPNTTSVTVHSKTIQLDRLTYELTQFIPLAIIFLLTIGFYIWGQLESRNKDVIVEAHVGEASSPGAGE